MVKEVKLFEDYSLVYDSSRHDFIELHHKEHGYLSIACIPNPKDDIEKMMDNIHVTDEDDRQFCIEVVENERYIYMQIDQDDEDYIGKTVSDLDISYSKLTEQEIEESISGYYESLHEVKQIYGDQYKMIVVECYFECSLV